MKDPTLPDAAAVALEQLQALIAALDRRVPQIERVGEFAIAEEAATLRQKALERIAQLGPPTSAAD
jgi:hypothetical protein